MTNNDFRNRLPEPEPTAEEQEWLGRVEKIAPAIEENRARSETERESPREVFEALRDAGIPRMWVSRAWGGEQVSLETGSAVVQALARLDGSVGWQMGVQGAIGRLSDYLPEATAKELFADQDALVVGGVNPSGRAEVVPGGFRVSGEWGFASGSAHAAWLVCAAWVTKDGERVMTPHGPDVRMVFIPREQVQLLDTWYTIGLRGTGSHHYRVPEQFVADAYTVSRTDMLRPPAARASRGYPVGYYDFGPFTSASTALGVSRDALDTFLDLAAAKTPTLAASTLAASHTVQDRFARAEMLVRASRLLVRDAAREVAERGETGGDALSALVRLTAGTVAENATTAVGILYTLAGSTSLYTSSRLERCFRDINSAVKHITLAPSNIEMVGQFLLGGPLQVRR